MEDYIYKLEVLLNIKAAISSAYSEVDKCSTYHECMELIIDVERELYESIELFSSTITTDKSWQYLCNTRSNFVNAIQMNIYYKNDWISNNRYPFTMFGGDSISVVVAMKINGGVVVAADSQITIGGVCKTSVCKSNYKVWHPSEYLNIVIGNVGSVRELNLIKTTKDLISEVRYIKKM